MLNVSLGWRKVEVVVGQKMQEVGVGDDKQMVAIEGTGDIITAEIKPLKVGDMLQIVPLQSADINDAERTLKVLQILEPNIGEYIRDIKGVQVDGEDINPQMLCTEFALVEVSASFMSELLGISQLSGEEVKNSEGQPEPSGS